MSTPSKADKADKFQKALLGGLEKFWGRPENMSAINVSVPKVLMELYQVDIIDEEVIRHWGTHASSKYVDKETSKKVRKCCEPILKVSFGCDGCDGRVEADCFLRLSVA